MPNPTEAQIKAAFAAELRRWWSFDDRQYHTHSWHDRENFIEQKLPELLHAALLAADLQGRKEAFEEAAKVAETVPVIITDACFEYGTVQITQAREDIAAAIRARGQEDAS